MDFISIESRTSWAHDDRHADKARKAMAILLVTCFFYKFEHFVPAFGARFRTWRAGWRRRIQGIKLISAGNPPLPPSPSKSVDCFGGSCVWGFDSTLDKWDAPGSGTTDLSFTRPHYTLNHDEPSNVALGPLGMVILPAIITVLLGTLMGAAMIVFRACPELVSLKHVKHDTTEVLESLEILHADHELADWVYEYHHWASNRTLSLSLPANVQPRVPPRSRAEQEADLRQALQALQATPEWPEAHCAACCDIPLQFTAPDMAIAEDWSWMGSYWQALPQTLVVPKIHDDARTVLGCFDWQGPDIEDDRVTTIAAPDMVIDEDWSFMGGYWRALPQTLVIPLIHTDARTILADVQFKGFEIEDDRATAINFAPRDAKAAAAVDQAIAVAQSAMANGQEMEPVSIRGTAANGTSLSSVREMKPLPKNLNAVSDVSKAMKAAKDAMKKGREMDFVPIYGSARASLIGRPDFARTASAPSMASPTPQTTRPSLAAMRTSPANSLPTKRSPLTVPRAHRKSVPVPRSSSMASPRTPLARRATLPTALPKPSPASAIPSYMRGTFNRAGSPAPGAKISPRLKRSNTSSATLTPTAAPRSNKEARCDSGLGGESRRASSTPPTTANPKNAARRVSEREGVASPKTPSFASPTASSSRRVSSIPVSKLVRRSSAHKRTPHSI